SRGFLEPSLENFVVLAGDGGAKKIIGERQQAEAAQTENEGIPEAEPDADVPAQIKQAGAHNQLLGWCGSWRELYRLCCASDGRGHRRRWFGDRKCSRRYARESWSWSPDDWHGASDIRAGQIRAVAIRFFLRPGALRV